MEEKSTKSQACYKGKRAKKEQKTGRKSMLTNHGDFLFPNWRPTLSPNNFIHWLGFEFYLLDSSEIRWDRISITTFLKIQLVTEQSASITEREVIQ